VDLYYAIIAADFYLSLEGFARRKISEHNRVVAAPIAFTVKSDDEFQFIGSALG
jgi:hypothetical protein